MYPETVGRSLEEVEEFFSQGHMFTACKIVAKKTLEEVVEKSKICQRRNRKIIKHTNNPGLVDKSDINSLSYL